MTNIAATLEEYRELCHSLSKDTMSLRKKIVSLEKSLAEERKRLELVRAQRDEANCVIAEIQGEK